MQLVGGAPHDHSKCALLVVELLADFPDWLAGKDGLFAVRARIVYAQLAHESLRRRQRPPCQADSASRSVAKPKFLVISIGPSTPSANASNSSISIVEGLVFHVTRTAPSPIFITRHTLPDVETNRRPTSGEISLGRPIYARPAFIARAALRRRSISSCVGLKRAFRSCFAGSGQRQRNQLKKASLSNFSSPQSITQR